MRLARPLTFVVLLVIAGCSMQPYRTQPAPGTPGSTPGDSGEGPAISDQPPVPVPGTTDPTIDVNPPSPLPRERPRVAPATLGPASKSLVAQAQAQRKRGDLPGASVSLERALRIEPSNPLLWIEMGRLRMDQQNFAQAEAMGRKALSMAVGDNQTQSIAWMLISDALRARDRNTEAQDARERSEALSTS